MPRKPKIAAVPVKIDPLVVAHEAANDPLVPLHDKIRAFEAALPFGRTHHADFMRTYAMLLLEANGVHDGASLAALQAAVSLSPLDTGLWAELATAYIHHSRFDECLRCMDESLRINPNQSMARWNRSLEMLARGEWEEGWKDYEYGRVIGLRPNRSPLPEWDGQHLGRRTLYIWCEQGLGDTLMMLRFVRDARAAAGPDATIIVELQRELLPLFDTVPGADRIVVLHPSGAFQCGDKDPAHISLMSLPRVLGITPETLTKEENKFPYPPAFYPQAGRRTEFPVRVGLVWKGSSAHVNDKRRSMTDENILTLINSLSEDDRFEFVNLQYGYEGDIAIESPTLTTFYETFQAIKTLDILVGVDTGVCHLAGAMACPVLLMLAKAADFRWMRDTERTPWYPNHYLFRQSVTDDWSDVIANVRQTLLNVADSRSVK